MTSRVAMLAAGGTGGHLFPAEALAHALKSRGWDVHLATDERAERFASRFPADQVHIIPSATIGSKNPIALIKTFLTLWRGFKVASKVLQKTKPKVVVGFGGYPTLPPLFAATRRNIPSLIHEQNAVMGRANRALASRVDAIAGGFLSPDTGTHADRIVVTGNPVRPAVLEAAKQPYEPQSANGPFHLLVFGGSQGALFFSEAIAPAVAALEPSQRRRLKIVQQAREEDRGNLEAAYRDMDMEVEISPFFSNLAERIAKAHLVISRSGASTVSEIAVIGRPALLVPYPYALDHDQAANAAALASADGAELHQQSSLSTERLAELIGGLMSAPEKLAKMAAGAKAAGMPDSTRLLADLTEAIASGAEVSHYKEGLLQ